MDELRLNFKRSGAVTRQLRRKCLYLLPNRMVAAVWLYANPWDLWDTDEDERRGWTHMYAHRHAETVGRQHALTGFYDEPEGIEDIFLRPRAKVVGLTRARQEIFFGSEWIEGNGVWEMKTKK
jgi:hypothetical protein